MGYILRPADLVGNAGKPVIVNPAEDGYEIGAFSDSFFEESGSIIRLAPPNVGLNMEANQLYSDDFNFNVGAYGFGAQIIHASAIVAMSSITKGFLPPKGTKAQRDAIVSPAQGLQFFVTDNGGYLSVFNSSWEKVSTIADP